MEVQCWNWNLQNSESYNNTETLYNISTISAGFNYKDSEKQGNNLIPSLICSLVSYEINNIAGTDNYLDIIKSTTKVIEQFKLNVENSIVKYIDGSNPQILWKDNDKFYNKIKIINSTGLNYGDNINNIYNVYSNYNSNTKFKLIIGGIPEINLDIISTGSNYGSKIKNNVYWIPIVEDATIIENSKVISVTEDLSQIISAGSIILLENNKFTVESITNNSITITKQYNGNSLNNNGKISLKSENFIKDFKLNVTNNSNSLTTSNDLSHILKNGNNILIDDVNYTISLINNKTITLTQNYTGPTKNNAILKYEFNFKTSLESIDKNPNLYVSITPNYDSNTSAFRSNTNHNANKFYVNSKIENGFVAEMKIDIPTKDTFSFQLVQYDKNLGDFKAIYPKTVVGGQLTGFELYSKGKNLDSNNAKIYNNLVTNITILNKGLLYDFPPKIRVKDDTNITELGCELDGGGKGAVVKPIIKNGKIIDTIIENRGKDYQSAPKISVIGTNGLGADLVATIKNNEINEIIIVSGGEKSW